MASFEDLRVFQAPFEELRHAVIQILGEMKARKIEWSHENQIVKAHTSSRFSSFFTGGELLTVAIDPSGEVWVASEGAVRRDVMDFGANRRNCQMMLEGLQRQFSSRSYNGPEAENH